MGETKHLSSLALATLTTGTVLVHGFAGVGEAAEWVMGHPVWTHELPRLGDEISRRIVEQVPDMPTDLGGASWEVVRDDVLDRFGETVEIRRGDAERLAGPITTLIEAIEEPRP